MKKIKLHWEIMILKILFLNLQLKNLETSAPLKSMDHQKIINFKHSKSIKNKHHQFLK